MQVPHQSIPCWIWCCSYVQMQYNIHWLSMQSSVHRIQLLTHNDILLFVYNFECCHYSSQYLLLEFSYTVHESAINVVTRYAMDKEELSVTKGRRWSNLGMMPEATLLVNPVHITLFSTDHHPPLNPNHHAHHTDVSNDHITLVADVSSQHITLMSVVSTSH